MKTQNTETEKTVKIMEPATTVIDEGKFLRIRTELPGIEEQKIRIELENNPCIVTILAINPSKQFEKKIPLLYQVRFSNKRFSDGILELAMEKVHF